MLQMFLLCLGVVALCMLGLCFNIIFRKNGQFPDTEVSSNKEMRKLGIRCAKEEEMRLWGKKKDKPSCNESGCSECSSCSFYKE